MIEVRDRLTDKLNRARLKLEVKRGLQPLIVSIVGVVAAIACTFYILENVAQNVYRSTREIGFTVSDASGVVGGGRQELRFKGVPAGVIDGVRLLRGQAVIDASLYSSFGPIYRNAYAILRPATALQEMYVDILDRGSASAGPATATAPLPLSQTTTSVQPGDVLNAFSPDVRGHLATLLSQLGRGLSDRGRALDAAFVGVVPFLQQAARLSGQLAIRSDQTRQLVHNVGTLTATLAQRQQDLRTLVQSAGTTLRTLQQSSPGLSATIHELPGTLAQLDSSFAAVRGLLPSLDQALLTLGPVTGRLPAGLRSLQRLSAAAGPAVRKLTPPVEQLVPLSQGLAPLAANLQSAVSLLRPQVGAIDHITSSVAGCAVALQGFFQWTPSVTKMWGPTGPGIRGDFAFGADNSTLIQDPNVDASPSCAPGGPTGGVPGPTLSAAGK
ncbi:MAG: MlaD family protein [Solirubrobacteraceae bacterium]